MNENNQHIPSKHWGLPPFRAKYFVEEWSDTQNKWVIKEEFETKSAATSFVKKMPIKSKRYFRAVKMSISTNLL